MLTLSQPLIIAVEENETVLSDSPESLGIEAVWIGKLLQRFIFFSFLVVAKETIIKTIWKPKY